MLITEIVEERAATVLVISGRLDAISAPQLEEEGISLISKGCRSLLIDLAELDYLSSAGLRSILVIAKKIFPTGGKLVLSGASGLVKDVLSMSSFETFVPIRETRAEGLAVCVPPGAVKT